MPGFVFDPLSQFSFKDFNDLSDIPTDGVPWSPALAMQHGMDVTCLPFTMTPFSLVDAARSLPRDAKKLPIRYDPESLKEVLLVPYPVLMPVYLLQYEVKLVDDKPSEQSFVIVDASTKAKGRMVAENTMPRLADVMPKSFHEPLAFLGEFTLLQFDRARILPRVISNWAKLKATAPFNIEKRIKEVDLSIDLLAHRPDAWQKYMDFDVQRRKAATGTEEIDWTDLRIRPYNEEEVSATWNYLTELSTVISLQTVSSVLSKTSASNDKNSEQMSQLIAKEVKKAKDLKPDWVKALEAKAKQKTASDSTTSKPKKKEKETATQQEEEAEPQTETTQPDKPVQASPDVKASDKGSSQKQKK
ncbi:hypothetical protein EIP86_005958 [Pleurotus ostreatoroseus]|nr:hypothetical protein EIP86_005958 [Pleurotus ostreatoroseus]